MGLLRNSYIRLMVMETME